MKEIRFVDLAAQNAEVLLEVEAAFAEIHKSTSYVGGPQVTAFEQEFAEYLGAKHVVGVSSGTDALRLALLAMDVGPGDEVITSPLTFIATAEAIVQTGARPTFIDVDTTTCNISPSALRGYLERGRFATANGPKAIIPVHLYGTPAPMRELLAVAERHNLPIVEDACQAHGASVKLADGAVRAAGTAGKAGCFSFYAAKNLGAWGEAGAVATDDADLAARIAMLRDHGRLSHYAHQECGYNARLDSLQAAVLRVKLKRLDQWNTRRRECAQNYREVLNGLDLVLPMQPDYAESSYHLFVVRSARRDALRTALLGEHIECGVHYPVPLHLQPALRSLGYRRGEFAASEAAADTVLSLPMHPHLTKLEVKRVAEVLGRSLEEAAVISVPEQAGLASLHPSRGA